MRRPALSVVTAACWLLAAAWCLAADGPWVRLIEVKQDPERDGQTDYTVRFTPARSATYGKITFECVYRQEFPWEDVRGRKYNKVHEPVSFEYRRRDVKFVSELDVYVSFRVPTSLERLAGTYGDTAFNPKYPVKVDRIRVTAEAGGEQLWQYEVKAPGRLEP